MATIVYGLPEHTRCTQKVSCVVLRKASMYKLGLSNLRTTVKRWIFELCDEMAKCHLLRVLSARRCTVSQKVRDVTLWPVCTRRYFVLRFPSGAYARIIIMSASIRLNTLRDTSMSFRAYRVLLCYGISQTVGTWDTAACPEPSIL